MPDPKRVKLCGDQFKGRRCILPENHPGDVHEDESGYIWRREDK